MDQKNDIKLRSEEVQEILEKTPHIIIQTGNIIILLLVLLLILLTYFIKYPDVIYAQATISTPFPPQRERAKIHGKIEKILVDEGQIIAENTPLAILKNPANFTDVFTLKSIIDSISSDMQSIKFPLNKIPIFALGEIETSFAIFQNAYSTYHLNKELQPFEAKQFATTMNQAELYRRQTNLQAQKDMATAALTYKQKDLERHKELFEKGTIAMTILDSKRIEVLEAKRNLRDCEVQLSENNEKLNTIFNTSKDIQINQKKEDTQALLNLILALNQLKASIKDWELKYVLRSEINGRVSFMADQYENRTVQQGEVVFMIIPVDNTSYTAKIIAPAQNTGKLKIGQTAWISLEKFPDQEFGRIEGNITHITMLPDNDGHYHIDVVLPKPLYTNYQKEIPFLPEMKGKVMIITEDLRLIQRLILPLKALKNS